MSYMWKLEVAHKVELLPLKVQFSVNYEVLGDDDCISRTFGHPFDILDYQVKLHTLWRVILTFQV